MIGLGVSFELGRYHATAWGAHVNEATVEWPPSPWRLLRALHSASFTDVRLADDRETLTRALTALATASPPSFELPPVESGHTRHFMPLPGYSPTKQGETSLVVDAFHALEPGAEVRAWWDAELDGEALAALARAACSVGYLGRSESVCSVRVLEAPATLQPDAIPAAEVEGDDEWASAERIDLLAVAEDVEEPLAVLGTSVTEMRRERMLAPSGTRTVAYAVRYQQPNPAPPRRVAVSRPTIALLRVAGSARPALTDAVTVGHLLRSALQQRYDVERRGQRSPVLSGHDANGPRSDQHAHAHFLSLPDADRWRVDRLVVWAPEGLGPGEVAAVVRLSELRMRDAPEPFRVALAALGRADELVVSGLLGPATTWQSVTPLALTRHPKRRRGRIVDGPEDQVRRELELRSIGPVESVELMRGDWMRFARTRPGVSRREASRVVGVGLRFAEPVRGPIALGGLSHFGLGLFEPEA